MLDYIRKTHKEFSFRTDVDFLSLLLGTDEFYFENFDAESFVVSQKDALQDFSKNVKKYLIY
jgi:hypothetical protein